MIAGFDWDGTLVGAFSAEPLPGVADRLAALPPTARTFVASNQAGPIYRALTGQSHYPTVGDLVDAMTAGFTALGWRPDVLLVCVAPAPGQFAESDWRRAASEVVAAFDVPGVRLHVTARPDWRKPQPGMLHAAAAWFDVGPAALTYVGDMEGDRLAAGAAGCHYVDAAAWRAGAVLFPCRGQLGLWTVPADVDARIAAALAARGSVDADRAHTQGPPGEEHLAVAVREAEDRGRM